MYGFLFKSRLRQLNQLLYVRDGGHISSVMLARPVRDDKKSDYNYLSDKGARALLQAQESGQIDEHICGCPPGWVPEHDQFDLENGKIINRGWRTILKVLVEKKLVSLARAKRVFNCPSLLEADFDKLSYEGKVRRLREEHKRA